MGGKPPRSTMALQDHQTRSDRRNLILIGILGGGYYPGWHQHAKTRVEGVVLDQNDDLLHLILDHSEERRQQTQIHIASYQ